MLKDQGEKREVVVGHFDIYDRPDQWKRRPAVDVSNLRGGCGDLAGGRAHSRRLELRLLHDKWRGDGNQSFSAKTLCTFFQ